MKKNFFQKKKVGTESVKSAFRQYDVFQQYALHVYFIQSFSAFTASRHNPSCDNTGLIRLHQAPFRLQCYVPYFCTGKSAYNILIWLAPFVVFFVLNFPSAYRMITGRGVAASPLFCFATRLPPQKKQHRPPSNCK